MENKNKRRIGRPLMTSGKRCRKIDVRFTEDEYAQILDLEKTSGMKRTDIVRMRVLKNSGQLVINAKDMMGRLDTFGAELGRIGNNINQLAKYANTLQKKGLLSAQLIERFNRSFSEYILIQQQLEKVLRQLMRSMGQ